MNLLDSVISAASSLRGLSAGQVFNAGAEITEGAIRTAKNHPKGIGLAFTGLNVALVAGTSRRGALAQNTAGAITGDAGTLVGNTVGKWVGGALLSEFGPVGVAVGSTVGGIVGGIVGYGIGSAPITKAIGSAMRMERESTRLHVGGDYQDTEIAYTMRQRAAHELSGSLLNARAWLGQEGNLLHS